MNPDFDYLFWDRRLDDELSLTGGIQGPHVTRDGRLCCRDKQTAYVVNLNVWRGGNRKILEVPL